MSASTAASSPAAHGSPAHHGQAPAPENIHVIVATDCGSTTTKAILIERQADGTYRQTHRGEAPTTVEAPFEDVTVGVINSMFELEELSGRKLVENGQITRPARIGEDGKPIGCDVYISTSSAGGGLQMMVAGLVRKMTAESAERAALGAGAVVMETLAANDKRLPHQQIERIRHLRPDMILLSGGTDGGNIDQVVAMAQLVAAADPRPRLGHSFKLPVIFAGNTDAREPVRAELQGKTDLFITENLRPSLEFENLAPARDRIHDLFMEHVMQQAPGYRKLMDWTDAPIKPTPGAVGDIIQKVADREHITVLGVDIGGATTDVFSVFEDPTEKKRVFNRTVSANLGMSYSISEVFAEAGIDNVARWVSFALDEREIRNAVKNKMVRPTTIPQALGSLVVEQALCREALRLAFIQHKNFATTLKGVQRVGDIGAAFDDKGSGGTIVDLMTLDLIVGSGGVLSHAPRRNQTVMMLLDAYQPEGFTRLAVDSIFMMPHLGVLSELHPEAATQVFERDCLIHLGMSVCPVGQGKEGDRCLRVVGTLPDGNPIDEWLTVGQVKLYSSPPFDPDENIEVREYVPRTSTLRFEPAPGFDVGAGKGQAIERSVSDGVVGVVVDCRGRPLMVPTDPARRVAKLLEWAEALRAYPIDELKRETQA